MSVKSNDGGGIEDGFEINEYARIFHQLQHIPPYPLTDDSLSTSTSDYANLMSYSNKRRRDTVAFSSIQQRRRKIQVI